MQVDHVIPVHLSQKNWFYRLLLLGRNVNATSNLVAACPKCNKHKSAKGGVWVLKGALGPYLQPLIWIFFIALMPYYIVWFYNNVAPQMATEIFTLVRNL